MNDGRAVYFETNKPLKKGEGLTIAVKFDNGIVKPHRKIQYHTKILSLDRTVKVNEDGTMRVRELFNLVIGISDWRKGSVSRTFWHESGYPRIKFISVKQNGLPLTFEAERNRNVTYVTWDGGVEHEAEKQYLYEIVYDADDQFKFDDGKAILGVKVAADGFGYLLKSTRLHSTCRRQEQFRQQCLALEITQPVMPPIGRYWMVAKKSFFNIPI